MPQDRVTEPARPPVEVIDPDVIDPVEVVWDPGAITDAMRPSRQRVGLFPLRRRLRARPPMSTRRRFVRDFVRGLAVIAFLHLFVVQVSVVRGLSMHPSLADGDRLVVDRLAYAYGDVERFDVVVLRYPKDPSVEFVKRVVGLPGDSVAIADGRLIVNGELVPQDFAFVQDGAQMAARKLDEGEYFVLGDNRPISCDSREFGIVPENNLKGKVRVCLWPFGRMHWF